MERAFGMISEIRGISAVMWSLLLEHPIVLTLGTLVVFFNTLEALRI